MDGFVMSWVQEFPKKKGGSWSYPDQSARHMDMVQTERFRFALFPAAPGRRAGVEGCFAHASRMCFPWPHGAWNCPTAPSGLQINTSPLCQTCRQTGQNGYGQTSSFRVQDRRTKYCGWKAKHLPCVSMTSSSTRYIGLICFNVSHTFAWCTSSKQVLDEKNISQWPRSLRLEWLWRS